MTDDLRSQAVELCVYWRDNVLGPDEDLRGQWRAQWLRPMATLITRHGHDPVAEVVRYIATTRRWWNLAGPVDLLNKWARVTEALAGEKRRQSRNADRPSVAAPRPADDSWLVQWEIVARHARNRTGMTQRITAEADPVTAGIVTQADYRALLRDQSTETCRHEFRRRYRAATLPQPRRAA